MASMTRAEELAAIEAFVASGRVQRIDLSRDEIIDRTLEGACSERAKRGRSPKGAMKPQNERWRRRRAAKALAAAE